MEGSWFCIKGEKNRVFACFYPAIVQSLCRARAKAL